MNHPERRFSTGERTERAWPIKDIFMGLGLLVALSFIQNLNFFTDKPTSAQFCKFAVVIFSLLILLLFAIYYCRKRRLWPLFHPMTFKQAAREFAVSSWYMFLILIVCGVLLFIPAHVLKPGMSRPDALSELNFAPNNALFIALLITVMTLGPIAEEVFFRGFLYNALKSRFSVRIAVTLQALVFTAFHQFDLFNSLRIFLFGIAFAIIYEKRKRLLSPISAHVFINTVATLPLLAVTLFKLHPKL